MDNKTRFTNLEMTLSFQERTIEELNKIVIAQQQRIDICERKIIYLADKVRNIDASDILSSSEEPLPPHY